MIRSMTAFGSARAESELGSITIDLRSVNNRYLDLNFRLPEEIRFVEAVLREKISESLQRGKVELRLSFVKNLAAQSSGLDPAHLQKVATDLALARQYLPDTPSPRLADLVAHQQHEHMQHNSDGWQKLCVDALQAALNDLQAARTREGQRLAAAMLEVSKEIQAVVEQVSVDMPQLLVDQQTRINERLTESLLSVSPDGFSQISGEELSARIAQEVSLFSLRVDVAEELTRLRSHLAELDSILANDGRQTKQNRKGSSGKRLDFLFQEMNREANTLGSKAAGISVTDAAINLKLFIEQLREQAQNIE